MEKKSCEYQDIIDRACLIHGTCAYDERLGANVLSCKTEAEMLIAVKDLFDAFDPDVVTGYNILKFDCSYLLRRAQTLGDSISKVFAMHGRSRYRPADMREVKTSTRAKGDRSTTEISVPGRILVDMLHQILNDYKLRSYTLNYVSEHFLKQRKEDVHHSMIGRLMAGSDRDRLRLTSYCVKDTALPKLLMDSPKIATFMSKTMLSRVTGLPLNAILYRGQTKQMWAQIMAALPGFNMINPARGFQVGLSPPPPFRLICVVSLGFFFLTKKSTSVYWNDSKSFAAV